MASDYFCKMDLTGETPQIVAIEVSAREARTGKINFPPAGAATDDDYRAIGYWPLTGSAPTPGAWQRVTGPTRTPNAETETVAREYTTTDYTLAERKAEMKRLVTAKRYEVETGGTTVNGDAIQTDAGSQAKLSGALQLVQADDTVIVDWKGSAGWVQLNATAVTAIATAVGLHVQAAFSREKALHDAVDDAADSDELDLIDVEAGSIDDVGSW